jgi:hypothetical protein
LEAKDAEDAQFYDSKVIGLWGGSRCHNVVTVVVAAMILAVGFLFGCIIWVSRITGSVGCHVKSIF